MYIPKRYETCFLMFTGFFCAYLLRVNLSIVIVEMADELNWDKPTQGNILGAFFYGYIITQYPGGRVATLYGGKLVLGLSTLITTLLTIVTPWCAHSVGLFIAVNVMKGLAEGVAYPCACSIWSKWAPPKDRATLVSFGYAGIYWGAAVSLSVCGFLSSIKPEGWPWVFQSWRLAFEACSAISAIWCVAWFTLMFNSPQEHPRISKEEKEYITRALLSENCWENSGDIEGDCNSSQGDALAKKQRALPWFEMITSVPVWALIIACIFDSVGFSFIFSCVPSYLSDVYKYKIEDNGFLSALPWLAMGVCQAPTALLTDWLKKSRISLAMNRKGMYTIGRVIQLAGFLLCALGRGVPYGITGLIMVAAANGACGVALNVNVMDIAPLYGGELMGVSNAAATISSIFVPMLSGYLTKNKTFEEWRSVFFVGIGCYVLAWIAYIFFCSVDVQPWAVADEDEKSLTKNTHLQREERQ